MDTSSMWQAISDSMLRTAEVIRGREGSLSRLHQYEPPQATGAQSCSATSRDRIAMAWPVTCGCRAFKMYLIRIELCSKCKIHVGFLTYQKKKKSTKKVNYFVGNFYADYMLI